MKHCESLKKCFLFALFCSSAFLANQHLFASEIEAGIYKFDLTNNPIKGMVKNSKGESINGVIIQVKGSSKAVSTDVDGNFVIDASVGQILKVSFLGYDSMEVVVTDGPLSIVLIESTSTLNEVVVGARFSKPRTDTERPVPVDIISLKDIQATGQVDLGQAITFRLHLLLQPSSVSMTQHLLLIQLL
jgi:hypothetical protein